MAKKITVEKAEQLAIQNIKSAVGNLQQVNSLLAESIKTNEVQMIENNETIASIQTEQEKLAMVNLESEATIKSNEVVIERLESHI